MTVELLLTTQECLSMGIIPMYSAEQFVESELVNDIYRFAVSHNESVSMVTEPEIENYVNQHRCHEELYNLMAFMRGLQKSVDRVVLHAKMASLELTARTKCLQNIVDRRSDARRVYKLINGVPHNEEEDE